jgi:chromosome segregation ATPase
MAPTITRETAQTLADTVNMVRLIDQQDKKIQPRFRKMYDGLKGGIDDSSADEIELYRPQLAKVVDEIDDALNSVQGALGLLSQLRADKDLMELKFEQIEKLVKSVVAIRKRLTEQAGQARKLDNEVDQALGTIKKGDMSAEADLGALQAQVKGLMKTIAYIDTEAPKLEQTARKAWDKKDQKALTDARVKLIDFLKYGTAAMAMKPRIEKYKKQYPDLDRARKAEVQWLLDDLDRAQDSIKRVDKVVKELVALGQVPKEAKKEKEAAPAPKFGNAEVLRIVKEFGLDTNDIDLRVKAMKVLNSCPIDQWPKELAKLYGVKESDLKAKLGNVRKLPAVKPLTLIDI